jgi:hypothetical protein
MPSSTARRRLAHSDQSSLRGSRPLGPAGTRSSAWVAAIGAVCSILLHMAPAAAQTPEDPPSSKAEEPPTESEPLKVRVRGGLSGGAGMLAVFGSSMVVQPALQFSGRVGAQFTDLFSLYYQNMATTVVVTDGSGVIVFDYNSVLANFTLGDCVDLGLGPSADAVLVSGNTVSVSTVLFGLHSRLAYNFAGLRHGPRRKGVSLGLDAHPTFGPGGVLMTLQAGLGYEWF